MSIVTPLLIEVFVTDLFKKSSPPSSPADAVELIFPPTTKSVPSYVRPALPVGLFEPFL
jgi:hypothetical protein